MVNSTIFCLIKFIKITVILYILKNWVQLWVFLVWKAKVPEIRNCLNYICGSKLCFYGFSILYFSHLQLSLIFSHYNIATMKVLAFPLTTSKYVLPVQNIKSKTEITSALPAW